MYDAPLGRGLRTTNWTLLSRRARHPPAPGGSSTRYEQLGRLLGLERADADRLLHGTSTDRRPAGVPKLMLKA